MSKNDEAAIQSIRVLLNDPRWEHRSFEKIGERFKGISDDELRRLLVAAGATSKKSGDGIELWSLEGQMNDQNRDEAVSKKDGLWEKIKEKAIEHIATTIVLTVLAALGAGAASVWAYVKTWSFIEMPSGAVVAFDLKSGCPEGWDDIGKEDSGRFAGRALIVVGEHVERDSNQTTIKRSFGDDGGEESVRLTKEQMPPHNHGGKVGSPEPEINHYYRPSSSNKLGELVSNSSTGEAYDHYQTHTHTIPFDGKGEPHNNMPPYIALYFCKKD